MVTPIGVGTAIEKGGALIPGWADRLLRVVCPYWAVGTENVPVDSAIVLIANHRSLADIVALMLTCPRRLTGPAKAELFEIPLLGPALLAAGAFPVNRDGMDYRAARSVLDAYRRGDAVVVFPEGHRSPTASVLPFSDNLARLVIKLEAKLVPAGIAGTNDVLAPGQRIPRRAPIVVAYGEPFELSEFYGRPLTPVDTTRAAAIMRNRVVETLALADRERARGPASGIHRAGD